MRMTPIDKVDPTVVLMPGKKGEMSFHIPHDYCLKSI